MSKWSISGVYANLSRSAVFSKKSLNSPLTITTINAALFWLHCAMIQPSLNHKSELAGKSNLTNKEAWPWKAYLAIQSSSAHDQLKSQQRIYSQNTCTFLLKGQLSSCGHCCQGARPHPPANHLATKMEYWVHVKQVAKHFTPGSVPMSSAQDFDSVQGESSKLWNLSQDESRAEGQFLNFLQHVCKRWRSCSVVP